MPRSALSRHFFSLRASTFQATKLRRPLSTAAKTNDSLSFEASAPPARPFPSLTISKNGLEANGTFAESQLAFLRPDPGEITEMDAALKRANMGVVSHYYMDPELQGVLFSSAWPHVVTSDSLAMGDAAVKMVREGGVESIACLGVDFMAESVRAMLDNAGYPHVPVYRLAEKDIGCSLAESAERPAYYAWLRKAQATPKSLHVVYINTSLVTKAESQALVPTITCTSSNVVNTILTAYDQVPGLTVWYGPDTYMGENLRTLFETLSEMPDEVVAQVHPNHSQKTLKALLPRLQVFQEGNCVVHHMFGSKVADQVRRDYAEAFVTAHLEVPGEMFAVANEAAASGRGVVGSTSNILDFIMAKTKEALSSAPASGSPPKKKLAFVLGTEAGMITPIVRAVQALLLSANSGGSSSDLEVEVVFPVAAEAVAPQPGEDPAGGLAVVPGAAGAEGCSAAGGCATCPFMKMNSLEALVDLADKVSAAASVDGGERSAKSASKPSPAFPPLLEGFLPKRRGALVGGKPASELGSVPILNMRDLTNTKKISDVLVADILAR